MTFFMFIIFILLAVFVISNFKKKHKATPDILDLQTININVAGVTFNNDDGTSRQHYLKWFVHMDNPRITFKQYRFRGKPAIYVLCEKRCIGNIPADQVSEVLCILDRIVKTDCRIDSFSKGREKIYYSELCIWYK